MKIELNGKALLAVFLLSSSIIFANYVSIVDVESSGGISIVSGVTEEDLSDLESSLQAQIDELELALASQELPIGTVAMWGNTNLPTGWIEMKGQSITSYTELSSLFGSTLPDMRGKFARGWDNSAGVDSGRSLLSYQADAFKAHNHTINARDVYNTAVFMINDNSGDGMVSSDNLNSSYATARNYTTTVSGTTSETRPKNIALIYIVKAE